MKTVKTCELIGPALDWAVAQVDGIEDVPGLSATGLHFSPSINWAQGGLLIEEYSVEIMASPIAGKQYQAIVDDTEDYDWIDGCTHLIAACRAIVAAKLGQTVQIPDELWTAENDTAPISRPDSENAGASN